MRHSIAYYLLILYVSFLVRPLLPFVTDFLDHEFSETIHLSTIHAKYGSNHLDKEIASKSGDNKTDTNHNNNNSVDPIPSYINEKESFINHYFGYSSPHQFNFTHQKISCIPIKIQERPPQYFI